MNNLKRLILISLFLSSIVWAREFNLEIEDSLRSIHPRMRAGWLKSKGIEYSRYSKPFFPDSQNVRLVGKWGRGPSFEVTGKDSFVFVSLGSEVAVVKVTNTGVPQILYEIQARSFVYNSIIKDSLLFIGAEGEVEIWNVANPQNPIARNHISLVLNDIFVKDTFLYTISEDSFKIFNVANLTNPYLIGACRDSGNMLFVSGNYAYLGDRWGLYVLNVSNPQHPSRISVISGGAEVGAVWVEGNHCYYTTGNGLEIANVQDPAHPWAEGSLPSIGGSDIYKLSYFLYLPGLDIIDVGDSSNPTPISHLDLPGWEEGVWANNPFGYAFVADHWEGLQIIDIHDPVNPHLDTALLQAGDAYDIGIQSNLAIIADYFDGLRMVNISNPSIPLEIGFYDTIGMYPNFLTAVTRDSFVFTGDWSFLSIGIADPTHPVLVGTTSIFNTPVDMIIRDSLVYVAENSKFEIFNVARPRQPILVGSCNLPTSSAGLCIQDTFAYISPRLQIINISNPANPRLISTTPSNSWGIAVRDTFAFVSHAYESLLVYSVANPLSPYEIGWAPLHGQGYDVVVRDSFAFVGCDDFRVFDISNPSQPSLVGYYTPPYMVRRVFADSEYIYAACFSAGVCIFEYVSPGIEEDFIERRETSDFSIIPNPVGQKCYLNLKGITNGPISIKVYNITGQKIKEYFFEIPDQINKFQQEISLKGLPDGVLFFYLQQGTKERLIKVTKVTGR